MLDWGGLRYSATWVDPDTIEGFALSDHRRLTVAVANDLPLSLAASAVVHEGLEIINFHGELLIPHQIICALEVGLVQFLTANGVDLAPLVARLEA